MTVSYSLDVSNTRLCGFTKLLARWRGGIYKILWREFVIFCLAYAALSITYRYQLDEEQRVMFEKIVVYVNTFTNLIPLSFVLGFYVSLVIGRWWQQYETIPWPDRLCFLVSSYIQGNDERSRLIRRTLARYACLAQILTFQSVSTAVKRRFPTTQHLVDAGIMTKEEKVVYDKISFPYGKYWVPIHWFTALVERAKKEGRIKDPILMNALNQELMEYRTHCAIMFGFDWISVPLVYTQVVTLAAYLYSISLVIGRQYLDPAKGYPGQIVDLYVPIFTLIEFFFYMGWLKVAEQIINPYGEDDDDFELDWCLDRGVHLAYLVVDHMKMKHPKMTKDVFWDEMDPILPQTRHSAKVFMNPELGSAFNLDVDNVEYLPMDALFEDDVEENTYSNDSSKSSFIRRILNNSSSRPSLKRKSTRRRPTSMKRSTHSHAFVNPTFDPSPEKNIFPNGNTTPSLNNMIKPSINNNNNPSQVHNFRLNSLRFHKKNSYDLIEPDQRPLSDVLPSSSGRKVQPLSRTTSAPHTVSFQNITETKLTDREDEFFEKDINVANLDAMATIMEESSRNASSASIEPMILVEKASMRKLQSVHSLVEEANKVLKELHKSVSIEETNSNVEGYSEDDEEAAGGKTSKERQDGKEAVVIDVEKDSYSSTDDP